LCGKEIEKRGGTGASFSLGVEKKSMGKGEVKKKKKSYRQVKIRVGDGISGVLGTQEKSYPEGEGEEGSD